MAQVKRFGVLQTAKFAAIMYFIFTAIFMIPVGLIAIITGSASGSEEGSFGAMFGGVFMFVGQCVREME